MIIEGIDIYNKFSQQYNNNNEYRVLKRNRVKEYIQLKILEYISLQNYWHKLILVWWSAIRLFFNSPRLSDDLDFNTKWLSPEDFSFLCEDIKKYLISIWHNVDIKLSFNEKKDNFYHCFFYIRTQFNNNWIIDEELAALKINIKIDSVEDNWSFPTIYYLPCKELSSIWIQTTINSVLLSKKIVSFLWRLHNNSLLKDLYDIVFLLPQCEPDWKILEEYEWIISYNQIYERVLNQINLKEEIVEDFNLESDLEVVNDSFFKSFYQLKKEFIKLFSK